MIAALYVERNGAYYGLPGVDPWDAERDARTYAGPWPVVAHPPCSRWCRLALELNDRISAELENLITQRTLDIRARIRNTPR